MTRIELKEFSAKEITALEKMDDGNADSGAVRTDANGAWIATDDAGIAKFSDAYSRKFATLIDNPEFAAKNARIVTLFNELQHTEPANKVSLKGVQLTDAEKAQPVKATRIPIFELTAPEKSLMEIPLQWVEAYIAHQALNNVNPLYTDTSAYDTLARIARGQEGMLLLSDIAALENKDVAEDLHWHFLAATHYSQTTLILPTGRHVRADTFVDPESGYIAIRLTDALDDMTQAYLSTTGDPYYLGVNPVGVFTKEELQAAMAGLGSMLLNTDVHAFMTLAEQLGR